MSLAMFAAPFNDNNDNNDNYINKKRVTHNKTQKRYPKEGFNSEKVNSILEKIHEESTINEEDSLGDFTPPPPPQSSGVQRTITNEQIQVAHNANNKNSLNPIFAPQPNNETDSSLDLNNFKNNYGDEKSAEEYYKNIMANYNLNSHPNLQNRYNKQYYTATLNNMANMPENSTNDVLLKKINYMINLLEEQQDERTNNVTEEVVLYSFLGIFIIFIADSFAKIGKYVR